MGENGIGEWGGMGGGRERERMGGGGGGGGGGWMKVTENHNL